MGQHLRFGQPPIEVLVRRNARARRLSLRVSGIDGRVSLTMPDHTRQSEAEAFLTQQEGWIRRHLAQSVESCDVAPGIWLPVEGQRRLIVTGPGRATRLTEDALILPERVAEPGAAARGFLKLLARDRVTAAAERYAARLGCRFNTVRVRDTRSRWGSCSSAGGLMFSWRLILAPPDILNYVAAHEVAHLREMNHSPAFWAHVAALMPDYQPRRHWLRKNGASLHAWRFGP